MGMAHYHLQHNKKLNMLKNIHGYCLNVMGKCIACTPTDSKGLQHLRLVRLQGGNVIDKRINIGNTYYAKLRGSSLSLLKCNINKTP